MPGSRSDEAAAHATPLAYREQKKCLATPRVREADKASTSRYLAGLIAAEIGTAAMSVAAAIAADASFSVFTTWVRSTCPGGCAL